MQLEKETILNQNLETNLKGQKQNIQKSETLEKIYNLLDELEETKEKDINIIYFEQLWEEYITWSDEVLQDIRKSFPRLFSRIKKNPTDVLPILQKFSTTKEKRSETIDKTTNKIRRKIYDIITENIKKNWVDIQEQSIKNLVNLLIHSPEQSVDIIIKKAREMEKIFNKKIEEPDPIFINKPEKRKIQEEELDYSPQIITNSRKELVIPELTKFATCQIFYYEEDYYDRVTSEDLLIDIRDKTIKFGDDINIFIKNDNKQREELKINLWGYPDLDYYFIYHHRNKWDQCIGGISLGTQGFPIIHIFNTKGYLRYGTKNISKNNLNYRDGSCTDNGDILPELVAKDTAQRIKIKYETI